MNAPREIDRADVLGELLHRFEKDDPNNAISWVLDTLTELDILKFRAPVDDPSKDPVGSLRREEHDDALVIYMKTTSDANGWWTVVYSNAAGIIGKRFSDQFVAEFPVFDSCPGTPAAEVTVTGEDIDRWAEQDASTQGPEMWTGDGSEEPSHLVEKVVDAAGDVLTRVGDAWLGEGGNGYANKVKAWEDHILPKYAPYTEVSS